jgi:hypothetical protein
MLSKWRSLRSLALSNGTHKVDASHLFARGRKQIHLLRRCAFNSRHRKKVPKLVIPPEVISTKELVSFGRTHACWHQSVMSVALVTKRHLWFNTNSLWKYRLISIRSEINYGFRSFSFCSLHAPLHTVTSVFSNGSLLCLLRVQSARLGARRFH